MFELWNERNEYVKHKSKNATIGMFILFCLLPHLFHLCQANQERQCDLGSQLNLLHPEVPKNTKQHATLNITSKHHHAKIHA